MSAVEYAEHCVEMAAEAETKKEERYWWREYRKAMIEVTGDKDLFKSPRSKISRPSRSLIITMKPCLCGSGGFKWKRNEHKQVCFLCKCGKETVWCSSNSEARDHWNKLQEQ